MNHSVSEPQLLQALHWRYATKAFNLNRKIPTATWATLQEALVLSASSFGLQPYRFIVVSDPTVRAALLPMRGISGRSSMPRTSSSSRHAQR